MGRKYELGEETVERYAGGGVQGVVQVGMMPGVSGMKSCMLVCLFGVARCFRVGYV